MKIRVDSIFFRGLKSLQQKIRKLVIKYTEPRDVIVGYSAPYAIYVHEATVMKLKGQPRKAHHGRPGFGRYWDPPGAQAKFLEKPAREIARELGVIIKKSLDGGLNFQVSTYRAGIELKSRSVRLVPIEYGELITSAFVEITSKK